MTMIEMLLIASIPVVILGFLSMMYLCEILIEKVFEKYLRHKDIYKTFIKFRLHKDKFEDYLKIIKEK